jgi:ubiquinone/menaquinone biosynthesis C-methylase UbiE
MTTSEFFLDRFSHIYPFSHCVWRVPEATAQASFGPFNEPMLDLGCGDGTYCSILFERVGRPVDPLTGQPAAVYGLDPQAHELVKAKKLGVYTETFCATSSAIPLSDAAVNFVFSNSVVEHIQDKDGTIREVARVLKPGGRYLFSAPAKGFDDKMPLRWLFNWKFKHYWVRTADEWRDDLAKAGLQVKAVRYTLTPENAADWYRYLLPSFLQHLVAKRYGWVPFEALSRRALERRLNQLVEPQDLSSGGNLVILCEKTL